MNDDSETSLSPAQDNDAAGLSATISAALAEHDVTDDTDDSAAASDDAQVSPEPAYDESDTEAPDGGDADQTDETDAPSAADTDTGPERGAEAPDAYRQVAEAFHGAVAPYQAHLASKGVSAPQAVQTLLAAEYQLSTGTPEHKAKILSQLARDYGVEVDALYELEDPEPVNPAIVQIQQRQAALERSIMGERQQAAAQVMQQVEADITAFADEKDAGGNLLRPHFAEVRDAMGDDIRQHPETDIQAAYDNAVWANPKLRKQALAQQRSAPTSKPPTANKPRKVAKGPSLRDEIRQQLKRVSA